MIFPRYWAKGEFLTDDKQGNRCTFSCWGWSDESHAAAVQKGQERARHPADSVISGNRPDYHSYGSHPLREEVLETFSDNHETMAAITRNSYGCTVMIDDKCSHGEEGRSCVLVIWEDFSAPSIALTHFSKIIYF